MEGNLEGMKTQVCDESHTGKLTWAEGVDLLEAFTFIGTPTPNPHPETCSGAIS